MDDLENESLILSIHGRYLALPGYFDQDSLLGQLPFSMKDVPVTFLVENYQ